MKKFSFKINVKKITKAKLYNGENGTYLSGIMILNDEDKMEGFFVEEQTKAEREAKTKGNILGNFKIMKPPAQPVTPTTDPTNATLPDDNPDDIPF
jgi:hypothetical protein